MLCNLLVIKALNSSGLFLGLKSKVKKPHRVLCSIYLEQDIRKLAVAFSSLKSVPYNEIKHGIHAFLNK